MSVTLSNSGETKNEFAVVIKDFVPKKDNELNVTVGEIVQIVHRIDKRWSIVESKDLGKVPNVNLKLIENVDREIWRGRTTKAHKSEDPLMLSFSQNEFIHITEYNTSGVSSGIRNFRYGSFPSDCIELVETTEKIYEELLQLLLSPDLQLTIALCSAAPVTAADDIAKALINIFEVRGNTFSLLRSLITEEAANTSSASTLFRSNSMASKMMSAFGRITGQEYLQATLRPLVKWISASSTSFEIDPAKMVEGDIIEENRRNLLEASVLFFNGIRRSISNCPILFRRICYELQQAVVLKFPESRHSVVGGFFFLRFLCPAIISPEGFGVIPSDTPLSDDARRALVLVSKLLQNLANGKLFGSKEAYMVPMQNFITSNQDDINNFFDELATLTNEVKTITLLTVPENDFREYVRYIHVQLDRYYGLIAAKLIPSAPDGTAAQVTSGPLLHLKDILKRLGPAPDEGRLRQRIAKLSVQGLRKETTNLNNILKNEKKVKKGRALQEGERIKLAKDGLAISEPQEVISARRCSKPTSK
eukprot:TRINITY_DN1038_c1_g1_i1.p1 TRINITY_DN1038_c1_g1~~TRINITY_DN1038_c1_g1_i1.p1  ORF type:complete len:534 (+),score=237.73 TRINITY_DN1038_c1_g1_i1:74-1675(+)